MNLQFYQMKEEEEHRNNKIIYFSVESVTHLKVLILEKHDFWFIFGDGIGG